MAKKVAETKTKAKVVKSTTTVKELRGQSIKELAETLKSIKTDLAEAQRSHAAGELVNPRVLGGFKKTIARVNTLMKEKALETKGKEDK